MIATEVAASKGNVISALKPLNPLEVVFFHGEDGDEHALLVERAFFDDVEDVESTYSFVCVPDSEEKPIVVAVGVEVVFDDEMVLLGVGIWSGSVDAADVAVFEAGVDAVVFPVLSQNMNLQL